MTDQSAMIDKSQFPNRNYLPWPPPRPPPPRPPLPAVPENLQVFQGLPRPSFPPAKPKGSNWKPKNLYQSYRKKPGRYFEKRKRAKNYHFAPITPHNTTSFLIRAKNSGGIASLVSPCPVTPSVLPTPKFSPAREVLAEVAKEEWGVDGYGSMNGLIRLRSPENEPDPEDFAEEEEGVVDSGDSDVGEMEKRLDHDLSRFEMIYDPRASGSVENSHSIVLEGRFDDQDEHIDRLEEENFMLKERVFLMERELAELRRRVRCLEGDNERGTSENEDEVDGTMNQDWNESGSNF